MTDIEEKPHRFFDPVVVTGDRYAEYERVLRNHQVRCVSPINFRTLHNRTGMFTFFVSDGGTAIAVAVEFSIAELQEELKRLLENGEG